MISGLAEIAEVGRDRQRGGYSRHLWDAADRELRSWFVERAERIGLDVEVDRNGNLWAWWGLPGPNAVVTGSHLDSVPGGGAFDGPLGVVSALEAVARLKASGVKSSRPVAVLVFAEEEGSRFGVACLGSRLMTGALPAEKALALVDRSGVTLAEAAASAGLDPAYMGVDRASVDRIGVFIELHVEQGRGLIDLGAPVALASSIVTHGRWRISIAGQGNHAGATLMTDRRDPMVAAARSIVAVQQVALGHPDARATVGRIEVTPGGTNVIASRVDAWLDARTPTDVSTRALVAEVLSEIQEIGRTSGCEIQITEESWSGMVALTPEFSTQLDGVLGGVPFLASGAGHDAGVLATELPSAMVFVRNPTGISHSPEEFAEVDDCLAGIDALERALRSLV